MNEQNYYEAYKEINQLFDPEADIASIWDVADMQDATSDQDYFPIGFDLFSQVMDGGVCAGDLVVISGRTGHGKTTFAQTLSYHLNKIALPQLWFSYEMQIKELRKKFSAMGLDKEFLGFCPLKIKSGNVEWIEKRVANAIGKFNVKVIFVDHLGFLAPKLSSGDIDRNYSAYLGQITRQLKELAVNNNLIVVLIAHTRKTKEAVDIEDIAHSGGVAQESDFVFVVEREKMPVKKLSDQDQGEVFSKFTKISLLKNRRTGINKFIKCQLSGGRLVESSNNFDVFP